MFLVVPLSGLLLAAFVGEPVPLLSWILNREPGPLIKTVADKGTLLYFREFFETPRYYKGFFNAVGLAPVVLTIQFFLAWFGEKLISSPTWRFLRGPGLLSTFGLVCVAAAARWRRRARWCSSPPRASARCA